MMDKAFLIRDSLIISYFFVFLFYQTEGLKLLFFFLVCPRSFSCAYSISIRYINICLCLCLKYYTRSVQYHGGNSANEVLFCDKADSVHGTIVNLLMAIKNHAELGYIISHKYRLSFFRGVVGVLAITFIRHE